MKKIIKYILLTVLTIFLVISAVLLIDARPRKKNTDPSIPPTGYWLQESMYLAYKLDWINVLNLTPPLPNNLTLYPDVVYKKVDTLSLLMDIYRSQELDTNKRYPTLVLIHGGGWKTGERFHLNNYAFHYAQKGYVVANIAYRVSQIKPFPAAVEDAQDAIRWLKANAQTYGIDTENMAVLGGSAGAHLAMMSAYANEDSPIQEIRATKDSISCKVKAIINIYGPTDLTIPKARDLDLVQEFMDCKYEDCSDKYIWASPKMYITPDDPPTLTFHGDIDRLVKVRHADSLDVWLKGKGVPHEYHRLEGWPHAMDIVVEVHEYCKYYIDRFLEKHLN